MFYEEGFNYHLNEAIVSHEPAFAFRGLSEEGKANYRASLVSNIASSLEQRAQLRSTSAVSDAAFKASFQTIYFRHDASCADPLAAIPELLTAERNELEFFFIELSPYIKSQVNANATQQQFIESLKESEKYNAAFDFSGVHRAFSEIMAACHGSLPPSFK